jgi:hypothetical protein
MQTDVQIFLKLVGSTSPAGLKIATSEGVAKGLSMMSWVIPFAVNFAIVLVSYLIGRVSQSTDFDDILPFVTLMQSVLVWGLFAVYWLNDWYWGFNG